MGKPHSICICEQERLRVAESEQSLERSNYHLCTSSGRRVYTTVYKHNTPPRHRYHHFRLTIGAGFGPHVYSSMQQTYGCRSFPRASNVHETYLVRNINSSLENSRTTSPDSHNLGQSCICAQARQVSRLSIRTYHKNHVAYLCSGGRAVNENDQSERENSE